MEIIIGSLPPLGNTPPKNVERNSPLIEAQLLHVRPPRKGIAGPSGMERRERKVKDPLKGRVLTIMVADGSTLPADLDGSKYAVQLRFVKK